jgi:hypothetical protein
MLKSCAAIGATLCLCQKAITVYVKAIDEFIGDLQAEKMAPGTISNHVKSVKANEHFSHYNTQYGLQQIALPRQIVIEVEIEFLDNDLGRMASDFIDRLFCDVDGFQVLCNSCHDAKTMMEDTLRAKFNKESFTFVLSG